jgi:hypothetical protein
LGVWVGGLGWSWGFGLGFFLLGGGGGRLGLGLGPEDPLNPLHGGVSALDAAGVGGGGWCGGHRLGLFLYLRSLNSLHRSNLQRITKPLPLHITPWFQNTHGFNKRLYACVSVHHYDYFSDNWDWTIYPRPRFASEFGFQSWCSLQALKAVAIDSDFSWDGDFANHRNHHPDGKCNGVVEGVWL